MDAMLQRFLYIWAPGNPDQRNAYAAERGLRANDLFWAVTQVILPMAEAKSRERTLLDTAVAACRWAYRGVQLDAVQSELFSTTQGVEG